MQSPKQYLRDALNIIKNNAYYIDNISDWDALYEQALTMIASATSPADTYEAIRMVLQQLKDNHSFFLSVERNQQLEAPLQMSFGFEFDRHTYVVWQVDKDSHAQKYGLQLGDTLYQINGTNLPEGLQLLKEVTTEDTLLFTFKGSAGEATFQLRLPCEEHNNFLLPETKMLSESIAYIELHRLIVPNIFEDYALTVRRFLSENEKYLDGIIIDLRRNKRGNMYPMLASISPLLNGDVVGAFYNGKEKSVWTNDDVISVGEYTPFTFTQAPPPIADMSQLPIAVLIGNYTGSSGEMTLISLLGRDKTRTFGMPSKGRTTANKSIDLSDGAILVLTTDICLDRRGIQYEGSIRPDEQLEFSWLHYGTDEDLAIQAAKNWLHEQRN